MPIANSPPVVAPFFDSTLGTAAASFTISGITGGFSTIEIDLYGRGDTAAGTFNPLMQFNGDITANYDWTAFHVYSSAAAAGYGATGDTSMQACWMPAASVTAKSFGAARIIIPNYADSTHDKGFHAEGGWPQGYSLTNIHWQSSSGWWHPSASSAITSVTIKASVGNFTAGSRCTCRLI